MPNQISLKIDMDIVMDDIQNFKVIHQKVQRILSRATVKVEEIEIN